MARNEDLYAAILRGDRAKVQDIFTTAIERNLDVNELLDNSMIPAMREMGERFSRNEIYVPEMLIAARAMQAGLNLIELILALNKRQSPGKIAVGTVKGDLHDIGKNLVVMMLKGAGFEVADLGVDVPPAEFLKAADRGYKVVCLSALLTTTKNAMRDVVAQFRAAGRNDVRIVVGGAVITQDYADLIGADAFGCDAPDAVRAVKSVLPLHA